MNNTLGFFICIAYVFAIIGGAELLRRYRGYGSDFTRKVIHIGVGMMSWALPFLFDSPWPFVIAALGFAVLNLLDWRYGFFSSMASSDANNLGTVYFPIAAATVSLLFWDRAPLMVAALMPLTWGTDRPGGGPRLWAQRLYRLRAHAHAAGLGRLLSPACSSPGWLSG